MPDDFEINIEDPTSTESVFQRRSSLSKKKPSEEASEEDNILFANFNKEAREKFNNAKTILVDPESSNADKMEAIAVATAHLSSLLFNEAVAKNPNVDRSIVISRLLISLRDISKVIKDKRDIEVSDEINIRSEKFQLVFGWFMDMIHEVLSRHTHPTVLSNIFNDLATVLGGWEDSIERKMKSVNAKTIRAGALDSPFTKDFIEQRQKISRDMGLIVDHVEDEDQVSLDDHQEEDQT